jgi:hypothetical protein
MMSWIQQWIIDFNAIAGGIQVNLSYTGLLGIAWLVTVMVGRKLRKRHVIVAAPATE